MKGLVALGLLLWAAPLLAKPPVNAAESGPTDVQIRTLQPPREIDASKAEAEPEATPVTHGPGVEVTATPTPRPTHLFTVELISYGVGLGYEQALGRWVGLKGLASVSSRDCNCGAIITEQAADLMLLGHPFGAAPDGFFGGGHVRPYRRTTPAGEGSSLRMGPLVGYNLNLFRGLTLSYTLTWDYEHVLVEPGKGATAVIWEADTANGSSGRIYNWFTIGYMF